MEILKKLIIQHLIDLICLTEVNKDWRVTREKIQFGMGPKDIEYIEEFKSPTT